MMLPIFMHTLFYTDQLMFKNQCFQCIYCIYTHTHTHTQRLPLHTGAPQFYGRNYIFLIFLKHFLFISSNLTNSPYT